MVMFARAHRTVEEIILAFDTTYKTVKNTFATFRSQFKDKTNMTVKDEAMALLIFFASLQNLSNALSRLQPISSLD